LKRIFVCSIIPQANDQTPTVRVYSPQHPPDRQALMPPDIGTDVPNRFALADPNLPRGFIWLHGAAESPPQHRTMLGADLTVVHGERQLLILDPGMGDRLDGASQLPGELFQERAATASRRMEIAAVGSLGFQAVIADIGEASDADATFEILQSPAADDADGHAGRVPELFQERPRPIRHASFCGMLRKRSQGSVEIQKQTNMPGSLQLTSQAWPRMAKRPHTAWGAAGEALGSRTGRSRASSLTRSAAQR